MTLHDQLPCIVHDMVIIIPATELKQNIWFVQVRKRKQAYFLLKWCTYINLTDFRFSYIDLWGIWQMLYIFFFFFVVVFFLFRVLFLSPYLLRMWTHQINNLWTHSSFGSIGLNLLKIRFSTATTPSSQSWAIGQSSPQGQFFFYGFDHRCSWSFLSEVMVKSWAKCHSGNSFLITKTQFVFLWFLLLFAKSSFYN